MLWRHHRHIKGHCKVGLQGTTSCVKLGCSDLYGAWGLKTLVLQPQELRNDFHSILLAIIQRAMPHWQFVFHSTWEIWLDAKFSIHGYLVAHVRASHVVHSGIPLP